MIAPDKVGFEKLITKVLKDYHNYISSMETGWEVHKDDYGTPLFAAPFVSVKLKNDNEYIAELMESNQVRIKQ